MLMASITLLVAGFLILCALMAFAWFCFGVKKDNAGKKNQKIQKIQKRKQDERKQAYLAEDEENQAGKPKDKEGVDPKQIEVSINEEPQVEVEAQQSLSNSAIDSSAAKLLRVDQSEVVEASLPPPADKLSDEPKAEDKDLKLEEEEKSDEKNAINLSGE